MTTALESKQNETASLPSRDGINDKHKWNLTDIYSDDNAWDEDYKRVQGLIEKAKEFAGKLNESPRKLFDCLEIRSDLNLSVFQLFQYARLNRDIDNRVSKYQSTTDRAAMLSSLAGAAYSFVEPEMLKMTDEKLQEMSSQFPKTDIYDFYITELIRSRPHIRSEEVEELLAQSAMVARGAENVFTMLDDADMTYPDVKDEDGNTIKLTKQRYAKIMESTNGEVRKKAHTAFYSSYKNHLNTLSASLASTINNDVFYTKARKFESCLHNSLDADNIPAEVYHSLISSTEKHIEGLHKYVALRKKILKLEKIHSYDMFCPLFPERDYEVKYDRAVQSVIDSTTS